MRTATELRTTTEAAMAMSSHSFASPIIEKETAPESTVAASGRPPQKIDPGANEPLILEAKT